MSAPVPTRAQRTPIAIGRHVAARLAVVVALCVAVLALATSSAPAATAGPTDSLDPGIAGPAAVDELTYDLGDQAFKPDGFSARVELKGRVYAPRTLGAGRAPLVILLHGRHVTCARGEDQSADWPCPANLPEVPSYLGYAALARNLASNGMIVVSIGANGINANDDYADDGGASARGQLVLEHLRRWRTWDASAKGSPVGARFVGHVDLADVGLMGHSRGGEGVVVAAQINQRTGNPFGIKAVMALAPVDFGRQILSGVPLGVILPYCDGDVSDLQGSSYYDDARYASPGDPAPKMTTLVYGANHNFFNTVWTTGPGSFDDADFLGNGGDPSEGRDLCAVGGAGRLSAPVQNQAGAVVMAGFFRRYLAGDPGLQRFVTGTAPFPASVGAARWSTAFHAADRLDVARYDSAATYRVNRAGRLASVDAVSSGLVCNPAQGGGDDDFGGPSSPAGVVLSPCPSDGGLSATNDTGVLDVGWVRPTAVVRQPLGSSGVDVSAFDGVRFRVAVLGDSRNDTRAVQSLTVVLEDAAGRRSAVAVDGRTNSLTRSPASSNRHVVLNGVRLPLAQFADVDLTRIRAVELRFDRTSAGRLSISDLAFTAEGTGDAVGPTGIGTSDPVERPVCRRTASARWGCALAQLAWGRDPFDDELVWLRAGYRSASSRRDTIALVVAVDAARDLRLARFAERYTQSDVTGAEIADVLSPQGRAHWETAMAEAADALAYRSAGVRDTSSIVAALYETITAKAPDAAGKAYWVPRVEAGGPSALAASLRRSTAARRLIVTERYRQILGRSPDAGGMAYWVGRLNEPDGERRFVTTLLATETFRAAAAS